MHLKAKSIILGTISGCCGPQDAGPAPGGLFLEAAGAQQTDGATARPGKKGAAEASNAPRAGGRLSVKRKPNRPARRTQAAAGRLTE